MFTYQKILFPLESRLWNFGGIHKIHKSFVTKSTGSTWVGKEERDNVETVHTHLRVEFLLKTESGYLRDAEVT